jgi:hypothetical protein
VPWHLPGLADRQSEASHNLSDAWCNQSGPSSIKPHTSSLHLAPADTAFGR